MAMFYSKEFLKKYSLKYIVVKKKCYSLSPDVQSVRKLKIKFAFIPPKVFCDQTCCKELVGQ